MNVLSGRMGVRGAVSTLLWWGALAAPALSAPMRTAHLPALRPAAADPWEGYFRKALAAHTTHVVVPASLRSLRPQASGLLPSSSFVSYLQWRRGLNARRFDANHPAISRMLIQDQLIRQSLRPVVPPIVPVVTPRVVNPRPQPLDPPRVPEPGSLAIVASLFGAAVLWRRRRRPA